MNYVYSTLVMLSTVHRNTTHHPAMVNMLQRYCQRSTCDIGRSNFLSAWLTIIIYLLAIRGYVNGSRTAPEQHQNHEEHRIRLKFPQPVVGKPDSGYRRGRKQK
jgi:hypothetical protein